MRQPSSLAPSRQPSRHKTATRHRGCRLPPYRPTLLGGGGWDTGRLAAARCLPPIRRAIYF
eukprot:scaffold17877_cov66-Phaeocystis_antarctica.AAC.14